MTAWLSPFPLAADLEDGLSSIGWWRWQGDPQSPPSELCWLYDTPDRLLALTGLAPSALEAGYRQLLDAPAGTRCVAIARLLKPADQPPEPLDPVCAALTQLFIAQQPGLLDAYLDLELKADLLGGEPDSGYQRRLIHSWSSTSVCERWREISEERAREAQQSIAALQAEVETLRTQEGEAREEAELTLLQLHQVQEELEVVFLADREKQKQLDELRANTTELDQLRADLAAVTGELEASNLELAGLRTQETEAREEAELTLLQLHQVQEELEVVFLADREKQKQLDELKANTTELDTLRAQEAEAREEAELTLLQLHQVQEELEHYFLLARGKEQQLQRYSALQRRSDQLLSRVAISS